MSEKRYCEHCNCALEKGEECFIRHTGEWVCDFCYDDWLDYEEMKLQEYRDREWDESSWDDDDEF